MSACLFRKFTPKDSISGTNPSKSSQARAIRAKILETYPLIQPYLDDIMPKSSTIVIAKVSETRCSLICIDKVPQFFEDRDGIIYPTLRLLHQYPFMMRWVQVDTGAIKFILNAADIMCPGLTSPGAKMDEDIEKCTPVAVMAEGKESVMAIGVTVKSAREMRAENRDIGVDNLHFLGDGLWHTKSI